MKRDELLDLIRKWIHEEIVNDPYFSRGSHRLILGVNMRERLVTYEGYITSFSRNGEMLFGIPVVIDLIDSDRLELVKVIRKF